MGEELTTAQSAALLDILTHYNTYAEIRDFRHPGSLKQYGPPFKSSSGQESTSPALQTLVSKFVLSLPAIKDLSDDFWENKCFDIIENLEKSNLSESYDKGVIGSRKTLATAISALIEYPVRGVYGGFTKTQDLDHSYDLTDADDLNRSFRDFMNECVYGNALDDLVKKIVETDNLDEHEPLTRAVHEFLLVNIGSFMHYTLILSPKGQYLLKLIENANRLVPYTILKQTLRIGNVATMINGVVKIALAKMSVTSLTNWMGITQSQNEGMNLMQQIISTVLNWDIKDLENRASKIERQRAKLGKDQLHTLKAYTMKTDEEQERIRTQSQTSSLSIVSAILQTTDMEWRLTEPHHKQALEYLSIQLSIRDRKEIIRVLCHSSPDRLTQLVRELVDVYEPVIRQAHNAIDLSGTLGDFEAFVKDLIKLAKIHTTSDDQKLIPTVGDFVQLLRKHQYSSHTFLHQLCKKGPELTDWYLSWVKSAASQFKREESPESKERGAGDMTEALNELFSQLSQDRQENIRHVLDDHKKSMDIMHSASSARLAAVLKSPPSKNPAIIKILNSTSSKAGSRPSSGPSSRAPSPSREDSDSEMLAPKVSSDAGPGSYLARWQNLLDNTSITPLTQQGRLNSATSPDVVQQSATDVDGEQLVQFDNKTATGDNLRVGKKSLNVKIVIDAMADDFRKLLASRSCYW